MNEINDIKLYIVESILLLHLSYESYFVYSILYCIIIKRGILEEMKTPYLLLYQSAVGFKNKQFIQSSLLTVPLLHSTVQFSDTVFCTLRGNSQSEYDC